MKLLFSNFLFFIMDSDQFNQPKTLSNILTSQIAWGTGLLATFAIGASSVNAEQLGSAKDTANTSTTNQIEQSKQPQKPNPLDALKVTIPAKVEQKLNRIVIPMGSIDTATANYLSKSEKNIIFTGESSLSLKDVEKLKLCLASSQNISPEITFTAQGCNISFVGKSLEQTLNIQVVGNLGAGWGVYGNALLSNQSPVSPAIGVSQFGKDWGGFVEYDPSTNKFFVRIVGGF